MIVNLNLHSSLLWLLREKDNHAKRFRNNINVHGMQFLSSRPGEEVSIVDIFQLTRARNSLAHVNCVRLDGWLQVVLLPPPPPPSPSPRPPPPSPPPPDSAQNTIRMKDVRAAVGAMISLRDEPDLFSPVRYFVVSRQHSVCCLILYYLR